MKIAAFIQSEGYCCLAGYVRLCRARGETTASMAKNAGVPRKTLDFHVQKCLKGEAICLGRKSCLSPVISELTG